MPELDCRIPRRGYYSKHGENIVIIMIYKLVYKYVLEIFGKFLLVCHWFSCYIGIFYFPPWALFSKESSSLKSSLSSVHWLPWNLIAGKSGEGEKCGESMSSLISEKERVHCLFHTIKLPRITVKSQTPECSTFSKLRRERLSPSI